MHGTAARPARTPRFPPEYTCTSTFFKHPGSVMTGKEPRGSASPMAPRKAGYRLVVFGGIQHGALSLIEPVLVPCYCAGRWASPNSPTPFTVSWKRRKASTGERVQPKNAGYWGSAVAHTERVEIALLVEGALRMTLAPEMTARNAAPNLCIPAPRILFFMRPFLDIIRSGTAFLFCFWSFGLWSLLG
jgi:hypothetical protein